MVKPPIQVFGIEGRYACALYSAASKQKVLDTVERDLISFQAALKKSPTLLDTVINPTIKRSVKALALREASAKVNYAPATGFFLEQLAENGRMKKVDAVINAFRLIMAAHRGEVVCEVISAKPLDNAQRKELESQLKVSRAVGRQFRTQFHPLFVLEIRQVQRDHPSYRQGRPSTHRRVGGVDRRQVRRHERCQQSQEVHRLDFRRRLNSAKQVQVFSLQFQFIDSETEKCVLNFGSKTSPTDIRWNVL